MKKLVMTLAGLSLVTACGNKDNNRAPFTVAGYYYTSAQTGIVDEGPKKAVIPPVAIDLDQVREEVRKTGKFGPKNYSPGRIVIRNGKKKVEGYNHQIVTVNDKDHTIEYFDFAQDFSTFHSVTYTFKMLKNEMTFTKISDEGCISDADAADDLKSAPRKITFKKYKDHVVMSDGSALTRISKEDAEAIKAKAQNEAMGTHKSNCTHGQNEISPEGNLTVVRTHLKDLLSKVKSK